MYKGYKVIDSDSHVVEPEDMLYKYLDKKYSSYAGPTKSLVGDPPQWHNDITVNGKHWGAPVPGPDPAYVKDEDGNLLTYYQAYKEFIDDDFSSKAYVRYLDWRGIDFGVHYPTAGLFFGAEADIDAGAAAALKRAYNDWLYDFCEPGGGRLIGVGALDLRDVDLAVKEAERCVKELGFPSVYILPDTPVVGRPINDPYYDPLWNAISELGVPLGLHSVGPHELNVPGQAQITGSRISFAGKVCSFVLGAQVTALMFCSGRILEQNPDLKVVFTESSAGWVPSWLWYLDEMWENEFGDNAFSSGGIKTAERPSDYFRRQCYVSAEPDEPGIKYVIDFQGDHNILYNTDFPHPLEARVKNPADKFLALEGVSDESKRKILWDNAAPLYGLG